MIVFADDAAVEGVEYPRTRFWDAEEETGEWKEGATEELMQA